MADEVRTLWDSYFTPPRIQSNGVSLPLRQILNWTADVSVPEDDPANERTNVPVGGGGGGGAGPSGATGTIQRNGGGGAFSAVPFVSTNSVLVQNGVGSAAFGQVQLGSASAVAGVLPVARGGTGLGSPGTAGHVLTSDGAGAWVSAAPAAGVGTGSNGQVYRTTTGTAGWSNTDLPEATVATAGTIENLSTVDGSGNPYGLIRLTGAFTGGDVYVGGLTNGTNGRRLIIWNATDETEGLAYVYLEYESDESTAANRIFAVTNAPGEGSLGQLEILPGAGAVLVYSAAASRWIVAGNVYVDPGTYLSEAEVETLIGDALGNSPTISGATLDGTPTITSPAISGATLSGTTNVTGNVANGSGTLIVTELAPVQAQSTGTTPVSIAGPFTVEDNAHTQIDAVVTAMRSDSAQSFSWKVSLSYRRTSGVVTTVNTSVTPVGTAPASWVCAGAMPGTTWAITGAGPAATNIRWGAAVRMQVQRY